MNNKTYFYVITRDSQIFEIEYTVERISAFADAMREKGIITIKNTGFVLNGSDISKILDSEQYKNYISSVRPRQWIIGGTWRDKEGVIRHENWKQLQIEEKKQLQLKPADVELSDEQKKRIDEIKSDLHNRFCINKHSTE